MPDQLASFLLLEQSPMVQGIYLLHLISTAFLCGVIWFIQVVHYPLMARTGVVEFSEYHRRHVALTRFVVGPVMVLEVVTALAILYLSPSILNVAPFVLALVLLGVIWLSTVVIQMPQHRSLRRDFSRSKIKALVAGNWVRTIAWSARLLLLVWLLVEEIH